MRAKLIKTSDIPGHTRRHSSPLPSGVSSSDNTPNPGSSRRKSLSDNPTQNQTSLIRDDINAYPKKDNETIRSELTKLFSSNKGSRKPLTYTRPDGSQSKKDSDSFPEPIRISGIKSLPTPPSPLIPMSSIDNDTSPAISGDGTNNAIPSNKLKKNYVIPPKKGPIAHNATVRQRSIFDWSRTPEEKNKTYAKEYKTEVHNLTQKFKDCKNNYNNRINEIKRRYIALLNKMPDGFDDVNEHKLEYLYIKKNFKDIMTGATDEDFGLFMKKFEAKGYHKFMNYIRSGFGENDQNDLTEKGITHRNVTQRDAELENLRNLAIQKRKEEALSNPSDPDVDNEPFSNLTNALNNGIAKNKVRQDQLRSERDKQEQKYIGERVERVDREQKERNDNAAKFFSPKHNSPDTKKKRPIDVSQRVKISQNISHDDVGLDREHQKGEYNYNLGAIKAANARKDADNNRQIHKRIMADQINDMKNAQSASKIKLQDKLAEIKANRELNKRLAGPPLPAVPQDLNMTKLAPSQNDEASIAPLPNDDDADQLLGGGFRRTQRRRRHRHHSRVSNKRRGSRGRRGNSRGSMRCHYRRRRY